MLLLSINKDAAAPVYRQVIDGIVRLIDDGTLKAGDRLPSTRALARRVGLNRFTLYRAYEELQALGYVESTPGSYTTVRKRAALAPESTREKGAILWSKASSPEAGGVYAEFKRYAAEFTGRTDPSKAINLSRLDLDSRLFPVKDFQRSMNQVLSSIGAETLRYGSPFGYAPLREYIATRLRIHGVAASPHNVLVTSGAQQALDLVLRLLAERGSRVAVERPSYSMFLPLLRMYGAEIEEIPMREDGMDLNRLEKLVRAQPPAFVYTVPNFQNPTGITTSQEHRERLLSICERSGTPLVEDGFEEEMKYFGKAVLPIKSMDTKQAVIYIGTFSKVLFPGLRIGWITAHEECIERLTAIRRFSDLSTSSLTQAVLDRFCRDGYYDKHLKRLHRVFRKRMETALDAMERHFPAAVSWTKPVGGYTIWVRLRTRLSDEALSEEMRAHGVYVSPGRLFFSKRAYNDYLRISISALDESEIVAGVERLGRMLRTIARKHGGHHAA